MILHVVKPERRDELRAWITRMQSSGRSVAGVLAETTFGIRSIQNIATGECRVLQLNDVSDEDKMKMAERRKDRTTAERDELQSNSASSTAAEFERPVLVVGPYVYDSAVFDWANQQVLDGLGRKVDYIILDEVGPLELKRKQGFASALDQCIAVATGAKTSNIVFVVRDAIRQEFATYCNVDADSVREMDWNGNL